MGFSRLYVGAHSMNQIVYGWLLGIWIASYFHYCLRKYIISHIDDILHSKNSIVTNIEYIRYIFISTSIFVGALMTQILTYVVVDLTFTPDPAWEKRIYAKCPNVSPDTG